MTIIRPQPGPQERFLSHPADVVFMGGAAGGSKTWSLLLDVCRFAPRVKGFDAVVFRRTYPEIMNPGCLWPESKKIFPHTGAVPLNGDRKWIWPKTQSSLKFSHMQHEDDVYDWQGSQLAFIGFDELTHFTETQFWYMLSRNRSTCGVRPYMRATMNPDADSWVRSMVDWYIGPEGYAIPERSGVMRYFAREKGVMRWSDDPEELKLLGLRPKSFTFIPSYLSDNKILQEADPDYEANLMSLVSHERERLLLGNWNARPVRGSYFRREMFEIVDVLPGDMDDEVRYWDRASTEETESSPNPDYTAGCKVGRKANTYYVMDMRRGRWSPKKVQIALLNTATTEPDIQIVLEQDPGQAGVADVQTLMALLSGFAVSPKPVNKSKEVRARPASAQVEAGNVKILRGPWNEAFLSELESFPPDKDDAHDDQVDAFTGAMNHIMLSAPPRVRTMENL